ALASPTTPLVDTSSLAVAVDDPRFVAACLLPVSLLLTGSPRRWNRTHSRQYPQRARSPRYLRSHLPTRRHPIPRVLHRCVWRSQPPDHRPCRSHTSHPSCRVPRDSIDTLGCCLAT